MANDEPTLESKGRWIVRMTCTVTKDVYCVDCAREQAILNPFDHAEEEVEVEQIDWKVLYVKPIL